MVSCSLVMSSLLYANNNDSSQTSSEFNKPKSDLVDLLILNETSRNVLNDNVNISQSEIQNLIQTPVSSSFF